MNQEQLTAHLSHAISELENMSMTYINNYVSAQEMLEGNVIVIETIPEDEAATLLFLNDDMQKIHNFDRFGHYGVHNDSLYEGETYSMHITTKVSVRCTLLEISVFETKDMEKRITEIVEDYSGDAMRLLKQLMPVNAEVAVDSVIESINRADYSKCSEQTAENTFWKLYHSCEEAGQEAIRKNLPELFPGNLQSLDWEVVWENHKGVINASVSNITMKSILNGKPIEISVSPGSEWGEDDEDKIVINAVSTLSNDEHLNKNSENDNFLTSNTYTRLQEKLVEMLPDSYDLASDLLTLSENEGSHQELFTQEAA